MRVFPVVIALAACTRVPPPACPEPPAPVAPVTAPEPPKPVDLDDAAVIAKTRALMKAVDERDIAMFRSQVGGSFVMFERGRFFDAAFTAKSMQGGIDRKTPPRSRTCKDERVYRGHDVRVYVGACREQMAAHGETPAASWDGWDTVVWTPDDTGAWKVAHWGWQKGGIDAERDDWNETYRKNTSFKRTPNQHMIDTVARRTPGTALDVAMGQGRNAIYLALKGWKVTGVDISDEGLRIAKENAAKQRVKLETVQQDLDVYDFGIARWDLVTMIYAGDDVKMIERIKPSLRPGGLFVLEYFHDDATQGTGIGGFATGELAKLFREGFTILEDLVLEDVADWGMRRTKLVRFAAEKK